MDFKMPDFTTAQLVAIVQAIIGVAVAFGAPISDSQSAAILGLVTVLGSVLILGDAKIRNGRAQIAAATVAQTDTSAASKAEVTADDSTGMTPPDLKDEGDKESNVGPDGQPLTAGEASELPEG